MVVLNSFLFSVTVIKLEIVTISGLAYYLQYIYPLSTDFSFSFLLWNPDNIVASGR